MVNVVVNGTFLSGFSGWTVNHARDIVVGTNPPAVSGKSAQFQSNSTDFPQYDQISQTVTTVIGSVYTLTFYAQLTGNPAGVYMQCSFGTSQITITNPPNQSWIQYTLSFTATQTTTQLVFASYNNNTTYNYLSNVEANTPDPEPTPTPETPVNVVCFKEGSQILTDKGYRVVQDLRKGDLVKTLLHGFKPIDMIGKKEIYHPASEARIKEQLYKCSNKEYPEVFEDLIITGCHSILVDDFISDEEEEQAVKVNGRVFLTDNLCRLPACVDERTVVYEIQGKHTIYHFALEHDDYYMNYGVFANGLLVETCSKRYLKELADMELIE